MVINPKYPTDNPSLILITRVSSHSVFTACENNHDPAEEDEKEGNAKISESYSLLKRRKSLLLWSEMQIPMKSISKRS